MLTVSQLDQAHTIASPEQVQELLEPLIGSYGSVEIVLVDTGYIRVLNRRYRHVDSATDVLSFDLRDNTGQGDPGPGAEGVIYVNERACRGLEDLLERVLHGYLHLRGMSHDTEQDASVMETEVERLLTAALKHSRNGE
jgi:probable rRNA maturation factor